MFKCREIKLEEDAGWEKLLEQSSTATFFQTREWLLHWVKYFSAKTKIIGVFDDQELIGIAPFGQGRTLKGPTLISFLGVTPVLGGELVSDFGDIIARRDREKDVWEAVLKKIKKDSSTSLGMTLMYIREDSPSFEFLRQLGGQAEIVDVAPYIDLPPSWEDYLASLDRHDRHELRRKMRKLEAEEVRKVYFDGQSSQIEEFFALMELGNEQKRNFLKPEMRTFFHDIITSFQPKKKLELCFLEYEGKYIAAILYFIFNNEVLLYNSGFDPKYSYLSPGLVLNAYAIREAIEKRMKRFDFLRGKEKYKYDLGGKERRLYRIRFD